jgi:hypothetical protein
VPVAALLREAKAGKNRLLMSVVNCRQAYYSVWNTNRLAWRAGFLALERDATLGTADSDFSRLKENSLFFCSDPALCIRVFFFPSKMSLTHRPRWVGLYGFCRRERSAL